jgi:hypothetical protein
MHTLLHDGIELIFAVVIGILFIIAVEIRPGGHKLSTRKRIGLFIVGLVIAAVFISTQKYYEVPTAL